VNACAREPAPQQPSAQIAVVLSKSRAVVKKLLINKFRKINQLRVSFLLRNGTGFVYRFCLSQIAGLLKQCCASV